MLLCVYINTAGHAQHNILVVNYARAGETSNVQLEGGEKGGLARHIQAGINKHVACKLTAPFKHKYH